MMRQAWIDKGEALAVVQQCALAGVSRATLYAQQKLKPVDESDLLLGRLIDEEYTRHPFYGTRRMVVFLKVIGSTVNRKRVQRLMREMGLAGMAPGPDTSPRASAHKVYPYLLRGVAVVRTNQVWSTDITYIGWHEVRLPGGDHRLVLAPRARLADQQQHGCVILRRLSGRDDTRPRQAGNLQQRSRLAVYQRSLYRRIEA